MEYSNNRQPDEMEIDLGEIFLVLVNKIPQMISVGLFAALVVFLVTRFVITPTYESTTKVYILNKQENSNVTYSDLQMGTQLTKDYAELIRSRFVLEETIQMVGMLNASGVKSSAYDMVSTYISNKVGKFTSADVIAACPGAGRSALLAALKKLTEEKHIVRLGAGRSTYYVRSDALR